MTCLFCPRPDQILNVDGIHHRHSTHFVGSRVTAVEIHLARLESFKPLTLCPTLPPVSRSIVVKKCSQVAMVILIVLSFIPIAVASSSLCKDLTPPTAACYIGLSSTSCWWLIRSQHLTSFCQQYTSFEVSLGVDLEVCPPSRRIDRLFRGCWELFWRRAANKAEFVLSANDAKQKAH